MFPRIRVSINIVQLSRGVKRKIGSHYLNPDWDCTRAAHFICECTGCQEKNLARKTQHYEGAIFLNVGYARNPARRRRRERVHTVLDGPPKKVQRIGGHRQLACPCLGSHGLSTSGPAREKSGTGTISPGIKVCPKRFTALVREKYCQSPFFAPPSYLLGHPPSGSVPRAAIEGLLVAGALYSLLVPQTVGVIEPLFFREQESLQLLAHFRVLWVFGEVSLAGSRGVAGKRDDFRSGMFGQ